MNKKRLTPQKQLEAILVNIKNTPKNIYDTSLPSYLQWIDEVTQRVKYPKSNSDQGGKQWFINILLIYIIELLVLSMK